LPSEDKYPKSEWEKKKGEVLNKSFHIRERERERELTPEVGISH
jgi:hypothetical protein